jgi:hypothetical protein
MEHLNKSEWNFRLGKMSGFEANVKGNSELLAKYSTKKPFILTSEKPFMTCSEVPHIKSKNKAQE